MLYIMSICISADVLVVLPHIFVRGRNVSSNNCIENDTLYAAYNVS
jgi:hypothetical protein